jgi:ATP-dependent RNA helicase DeaD
MTFEKLNLSEAILKALAKEGYTEPTPIQAQAIPRALLGKDLIATAQTGTGKTAAFGLPLLQVINENDKYPQALVVCPTQRMMTAVSPALAP